MARSAAGANTGKQDHAACSGCSLCLLVCPVWRRTRDLRMTPHGRAKALQHGATLADIASSVQSCTLCGACEPVCPENIDVVDMLIKLRRDLPQSAIASNMHTQMQFKPPRPLFGAAATATVLLATNAHFWRPKLLGRISTLLGGGRSIAVEHDGGADIALALEVGARIPPHRIERFLAPLRLRKILVVTDGLLLRSLRVWLPETTTVSLGAALSRLASIRDQLRRGDLYVIEPRAYHLDHATLVTYYDELSVRTGCAMSLDLQRIAIPPGTPTMAESLGLGTHGDGSQVRWLLKGRHISRIVIENETDRRTFEHESIIPVVHLAELADAGLSHRAQL